MGRKNKFDLNPLQKEVLSFLADSPLNKNFYWTGGTALAYLHLQHRQSEDIDLFSNLPVDIARVKKFIDSLSRKIKIKKIEERRIFSRYEFFLHNSKTLRVEFVHYDFLPLQKRKKWNGILVDSFNDMAANKTMAMLDRHDPKDAFDVYFLIHKKKITPKKLLSLVRKKFGITFPLSNFWAQGLLSAQMLRSIKPLLMQDEKILEIIYSFYERGSAKEMKGHLLD